MPVSGTDLSPPPRGCLQAALTHRLSNCPTAQRPAPTVHCVAPRLASGAVPVLISATETMTARAYGRVVNHSRVARTSLLVVASAGRCGSPSSEGSELGLWSWSSAVSQPTPGYGEPRCRVSCDRNEQRTCLLKVTPTRRRHAHVFISLYFGDPA